MEQYWMLVIFMPFAHYELSLAGSSDSNCDGKYMNCCEGFKYDFQKGKCVECETGYFKTNCSEKCPNGTYGKDCQFLCNCNFCHHADGCVSLEMKLGSILATDLKNQESISVPSRHFLTTNHSPLSTGENSQSNDSGSNLKQQTLQTHHGLYAIVSANTLLTLPITVAVVVYICRKRKRKKDRAEEEHIIYYHADPDPVYNMCNLTGINNDAKVDVYDALPVCSVEGSRLNVNCLEDVRRKARANSYVPVRERKPKENDELATEKAEYTQVKKVSRSSDDIDLGHSMTVDSLDSSSSRSDLLSTDGTSYIVPLVPERTELGRRESRTLGVTTLSVPIEDSENISIGSVVYTELM